MKKALQLFLLLAIVCSSYYSMGQTLNLVRNKNFMKKSACPTSYSQINKATNWYNLDISTSPYVPSTPDYHNSCYNGGYPSVNVPNNFVGHQWGHNGDSAYAGVYTYIKNIHKVNYREYIEQNLPCPLVHGQKYKIKMWVSLANNSAYATGGLGIYISPAQESITTNGYPNYTWQVLPYGLYTQLMIGDPATAQDTANWMPFENTFTANGYEQYVVIGNFAEDGDTLRVSNNLLEGELGSYYYIDDVSIMPVGKLYHDSICQNGTITLDATHAFCYAYNSGFTYNWVANPTDASLTGHVHDSIVHVSPLTDTYYYSTVTDSAGGTLVDTFFVHILAPLPPPIISGEFNTCHGTPPHTINNIDNWNSGCTYYYTLGTNPAHDTIINTPFTVNWLGYSNGGMMYVHVENKITHCTALDSFKVFKCCYEPSPTNLLIADTTYSSLPVTLTGNCYINGTIIIDTNVTFGGSAQGHFHMGPNAKIIINSGNHTLTINRKSVLSASECNLMWDGIYLDGTTAHLIIKDTSLVKDAKNAIYSTNGGDFQLSNSDTLKNNYKNIIVSNYAGTHPGRISKTTIKCDLGVPLLAQYPPVTAARTSSGVEISNVDKIYIGDTTAFSKRNTFYNMDYGIKAIRANIYVYNNKFNNIDAQLTPQIGEAIYVTGARNSVTSATIGAANVLPNIVRSNTFSTCNYGIYATGIMSFVKAEYDTMTMQTYSLTSPNGIYVYAASLGSTTIRHNKITNGTYGIRYLDMLDNSNINISSNYVEKAQTGIAVTNVNLTTPYDFQLANNSVNYPVAYYYNPTGILVTNVLGVRTFDSNRPFAYITTNKVIFTSPNLSYTTYGIRVQNSRYARMELNYVQNNGTAANSDAQAVRLNGIVDEVSPYSVVGCNKVIKMGCGLRFYGSMPNSKIKMDTTNNTWWGIRLDTANVGAQGGSMQSNANVWLGTQTYRLQGQWTQVYWYYYGAGTGNMSLDLSVPSNVSLTPSAIGWVLQATGYLTTCGALTPYTLMGTLQDIVYEQTNYPYATAENKYADNVTAYTTLKTDTALYEEATGSDPNIQTFYNTADAGNIGNFDRVNDLMAAGDYATATVMNSALSPANIMEANKKQTNAIYLDTWAKGRFDFTPDEYDALYAIAVQRPVLGGTGVYSARVMLGVEGSDMESYRLAHSTQTETNQNIVGLIYPNPVRDEANIDYEIKSGEKAVLSIYGLVGNKLMEFNLNKEENHFSFSTSQLNSGVYFYQLLIDGNAISNNKFIIVK